MKLIVGLGNPGEKYLKTRHNVGFLFVDYLGKEFGCGDWQEKAKFKCYLVECGMGQDKLLLAKPTTFMNLSGETLVALKQFYSLENEDILVVYDDVDLPFGAVRYRGKGSAGTHNGMKSVIAQMGTDMVKRLRIGVENRPEELKQKWVLSDYVLANFADKEIEQLPEVFVAGRAEISDFLEK